MASIADLFVTLGLNTKDFQDGAKDAKASWEDFGKSVQSWGAAIATALPFAALGTAAFGMAENFETAFNRIRVTTGETGATLDGLKESLEKVYQQSPASLDSVTTALTTLHQRLGLDGVALEDTALKFLRLSNIAQSDVKPVIEEVTKAFAGFGLASAAQGPAMDYLLNVTQKTGIGIQQLVGSLRGFAPILKGYGLSFEESAAMVGTFNKTNVDTERVLTSLTQAFKVFTKAGLEPADALRQVVKAIEGEDNELKRNDIAAKAFNRNAAYMVEVIREGKLHLDEFTASLGSNGDSLEKAAQDTETLEKAWGRLKHAFEEALVPLGEALRHVAQDALESLKPVAGWLEDIGKSFGQLPQPVQDATVALIAFAAVGPLVMKTLSFFVVTPIIAMGEALSGLIPIVGNIANALENGLVASLSKTETALLRFGQGLAIVGTLVVAYESIKELCHQFSNLSDGIAQLGGPLSDIQKWFQSVIASVEKFFLSLKVPQWVKDSFKDLADSINSYFKKVVDQWANYDWGAIFNPTRWGLTGAVNQVLSGLNDMLGSSDKVKEGMNGFRASISGTQQGLTEFSSETLKASADARGLALAQQLAADGAKSHKDALSALGLTVNKLGEDFKALNFTGEGDLTKQFNAALAALTDLQKRFDSGDTRVFASDIQRAEDAVRSLGDQLDKLDDALEIPRKSFIDPDEWQASAEHVEATWKTMIDGADALKLAMDRLSLGSDEVMKTLATVSAIIPPPPSEWAAVTNEIKETSAALGRLGKTGDAALEQLRLDVDTLGKAYKEHHASLEDWERSQLNYLTALSKSGHAMTEEQQANLIRLKAIYGSQVAETENAMRKIAAAVNKAFDDMSKGIADVIVHGKKLSDVFKQVADDIATAILKTIIDGAFAKLKKSLVDLISETSSLGKALKGLFGGGSGSPSTPKVSLPSGGGGGNPPSGQPIYTDTGEVAGYSGGSSGSGDGGIMDSLGGAGGVVGIVANVVKMISQIVSNFQLAKMETTLNAIEESVRYVKIAMLEGGNSVSAELERIRIATQDAWAALEFIKAYCGEIANNTKHQADNTAPTGDSTTGQLIQMIYRLDDLKTIGADLKLVATDIKTWMISGFNQTVAALSLINQNIQYLPAAMGSGAGGGTIKISVSVNNADADTVGKLVTRTLREKGIK